MGCISFSGVALVTGIMLPHAVANLFRFIAILNDIFVILATGLCQ